MLLAAVIMSGLALVAGLAALLISSGEDVTVRDEAGRQHCGG